MPTGHGAAMYILNSPNGAYNINRDHNNDVTVEIIVVWSTRKEA